MVSERFRPGAQNIRIRKTCALEKSRKHSCSPGFLSQLQWVKENLVLSCCLKQRHVVGINLRVCSGGLWKFVLFVCKFVAWFYHA